MTQPFRSNTEYLLAELAWLDLLIEQQVVQSRREGDVPQETLRGLFVSDQDVDHLLAAGETLTRGRVLELNRKADECRVELDARKQASLDQGVPLELPHVGLLFGLTAFEEQVILAALAPEVETKYERLFGYLHNDVSRRRATVGLALRLLCRSQQQRLAALSIFSPGGALFRAGLMQPLPQSEDTLVGSALVLDPVVKAFLLGFNGIERPLRSCIWPIRASRELAELRWKPQFKEQLLRFAQHALTNSAQRKKVIVHLRGPAGTGKKALAAALCQALGVSLVAVDLVELLRHPDEFEDGLGAALRYCLLLHAALYFEGLDALIGKDAAPSFALRALRSAVEEKTWLVFLGSEGPWYAREMFSQHAFVSLDLPAPDATDREAIWEAVSAQAEVDSNVDWEEISSKFRLTPGAIEGAFRHALNAAELRSGQGAPVLQSDIVQGCYAHSNKNLSMLAQKVVPHQGWDDLVLPSNALSQLREITGQVRHRQLVYRDWGFNKKIMAGKGLCVLFYGQSGVGKTMAAQVLANELQLQLYKIDLSTVVSKYIGETEKNLSRIFSEAQNSNAILFFDEADALFGKRSEVKDAHDRYANIEINYLLQRIEEFDGLVVLATNLRRNIDEGFFRRMHFAVEFPFPDESCRYRIWKQHFPAPAPLDADVDLDYLAKRFALSGGNIRNVVVNAAFLAAQNSGRIHMEHLIRATKREFDKIGRLCAESEFAPYQWALHEIPVNPDQEVQA